VIPGCLSGVVETVEARYENAASCQIRPKMSPNEPEKEPGKKQKTAKKVLETAELPETLVPPAQPVPSHLPVEPDDFENTIMDYLAGRAVDAPARLSR